jgi:hypothetical protein
MLSPSSYSKPKIRILIQFKLVSHGCIHRVSVGVVSNVSEVHAITVFRLEAYDQGVNLFCHL